MFSSRANLVALSFSVMVSTTTNSSEDMPMDMVFGIDVVEGRPSSDLIEATIAVRGLRTGRQAFAVVGGVVDAETAQS